MNILLDTMGGDHSPDEFIKGAIECIGSLEDDTQITIIGDEKILNDKIKEIYNKGLDEITDRIIIRHAPDVITNHDTPTEAIKNKKESSMYIGFQMLKNNEGDCLISAGNTGALMAGGLLVVGRIKGIDRPAISAMLPTIDGGGVLLLDAGANTNCKPINLVQFAKMGSIYMEKVKGFNNPAVGLLNIGAEDEKGSALTKETFPLLKEQKDINFCGNIEAREIMEGNIRVIATDGFTGNIALKTVEGTGLTIKHMLTEELTSSLVRKVGAGILTAAGAIGGLKKRLDYSEYGGALLLGISHPIIKCHGSSMAKDVGIVLKQAEKFVAANVIEAITKAVKED